MTPFAEGLPQFQVYRAVSAALEEDLGQAGDITTNATVPAGERSEGMIVARKAGRIAGIQFPEASIKTFDHDAAFEVLIGDGGGVEPGSAVARVSGLSRALLTGERVGLNFLCHLSGIATLTQTYVKAVEGTGASICCTRKTTPGLRAFEKYAVRAGGGMNHRFGLYDAVLIKDNHIVAAGGVGKAIEAALARAGHMIKIEIEVDTIDQLETALDWPVDAVLLDNMDTETLRRAVAIAKEKDVVTEASGGVTLETVRAIAETGVDMISVGAL
ncbi:MAG: carboxylating nicotinate-nucleotide diphosphorylase, partial [Hyphomicrobiales bacterium]